MTPKIAVCYNLKRKREPTSPFFSFSTYLVCPLKSLVFNNNISIWHWKVWRLCQNKPGKYILTFFAAALSCKLVDVYFAAAEFAGFFCQQMRNPGGNIPVAECFAYIYVGDACAFARGIVG